MSPLSPVIFLNEAGRQAFLSGQPVGYDEYGYVCAADDPRCIEAGPAVEANIEAIMRALGIDRRTTNGA